MVNKLNNLSSKISVCFIYKQQKGQKEGILNSHKRQWHTSYEGSAVRAAFLPKPTPKPAGTESVLLFTL